jgi:mRNA-degrading endonuclease RelE of RelBE toxin-antitoxin system
LFAVRDELFISEKARRQLRALDKPFRRRIGQHVEAMRDDLAGDVRKLEGRRNR